MKKLALPLAAALLLTISGAVRAQGGPPGGGMGGAAPSPEMMAMFKKFGEWRDKNKSLSSVNRTLGALAEFEKDPKTALTKDQAKKILAVVGPWKSKPIMTDANAKDMLKQVGATLKKQYPNMRYSIEGHTDSDPITKSKFTSNRDLSVQRAMAVLTYMVEDCGIKDDQCIVAGHGQYDPLAPNDTTNDKAKNRRVEIVVHKKGS